MTLDETFLTITPHLDEAVLSILRVSIEDTSEISDMYLSFSQVLCLVCTEIKALGDPDIYKILSDEIIRGKGKCFARRVSSIVSALSAISQEVSVTISDSQQISSIMVNIKEKIENGMDIEKGIAEAVDRLTELNIPPEEQDKWIPYLRMVVPKGSF